MLKAIGIEDDSGDPEAGVLVSLERGLSDGDLVFTDLGSGEIMLRTEHAEILRSIAVAATRGNLSISEPIDHGGIRRAELRDEESAKDAWQREPPLA